MTKSRLSGAAYACVFLLFSTTASAALIDNGGGLIYDDVLDITWAQPDIERSWNDANTWASGLTLGGATDWRLPYMSVTAGAGPFAGNPVDCQVASESACRDNELGYMFYQNLSGTSGESILESGDPDLALFPTLQSRMYWSGTEINSGLAWALSFNLGLMFDDAGSNDTWAVHAGNISPIPVPAAAWLFVSGLLGLMTIVRKKAT